MITGGGGIPYNQDNPSNPDRKQTRHRAGGPVGQKEPGSYSGYRPYEPQPNDRIYKAPPARPTRVAITRKGPAPGMGVYGAQQQASRQRAVHRRLDRYRGFSAPIPDYDLGSFTDGGDFGPRVHPVHGGYSNHTGLDFSVGMGTPIYAPSGGIVTTAAPDGIYGNQLIVDHGQNLQTMYGHLSRFNVQPGQRVKPGQVIGFVGTTGLSTGPHLHWETWRNGQPVNPMTFLGGQ